MSEMEILPAVETCMASALAESATKPPGDMRVMHSEMDTIVRKFSHLLYLPILRLTRPRDLYYYQGQGLCALYGFTYKYLTLEHFLGELTRLQVDVRLTLAVSNRLVCAWYPEAESLCIYTDWHIKPHWTKQQMHSGHVTMWHRIMPATKQLLINDAQGHPLVGFNDQIDTHLTHVLIDLEAKLATDWGREIRCNVFDSEGSGVPLAKRYAEAERDYLTVLPLRGDTRLDAFELQSDFEPVEGDLTHQAALAQWRDPQKREVDRQLVLMRRTDETNPTRIYTGRFDNALAPGTIPAQFRQRWICQERVIRQLVNGANLNANFGYSSNEVPNRTQKRRYDAAQQKVERTQQKLCTEQDAITHRLSQFDEQKAAYQQHQRQIAQQLNAQQRDLQTRKADGKPYRRCEQRIKRIERDHQKATDRYQRHRQHRFEEITQRLVRHRQVTEKFNQQRQKRDAIDTQTLCRERQLHKDQIMLTLQLLLMNLHQWVLAHYLAPIWQHLELNTATELIYRKPGRVRWTADTIEVVLCAYRYPEHQQAMVQTCTRLNAKNLRWHDDRILRFSVETHQ